MLQDAVATGTGFMVDGKRVDPQDVRNAKVSSPELATLAAKYVNMSDAEMAAVFEDENAEYPSPFLADVRRLAASVLAQAEGTPRK
jgi:hypothetical protein